MINMVLVDILNNMKRLKDILVEGSDYEISLSKLIEKPIKDIRGYLSSEFGDAVFKLTEVEFEDGTFLGVEGEHDLPYLVQSRSDQPNYDDETLNALEEETE